MRSFSVYPGASPADAPSESVEIAYKTMRYQVMTPSTSGGAGATEEVQWSTPDDQELAGWSQGCG